MTDYQKTQSGAGALFGIIVIVALLAAGAVYLWYTKSKEAAPVQNTTGAAAQNPLGTPVPSDSASAIEADLQSTDTGNAAAALELK